MVKQQYQNLTGILSTSQIYTIVELRQFCDCRGNSICVSYIFATILVFYLFHFWEILFLSLIVFLREYPSCDEGQVLNNEVQPKGEERMKSSTKTTLF